MNIPVSPRPYSGPKFVLVTYTNDGERFTKDPELTPFTKMPVWVRITPTRDEKRRAVGALFMMDGPTKNKVKSVHAGLIPVGIEGWFATDLPDTYHGRVCRNTVAVYIAPDHRRLFVYYFTGYEKPSIAERVKAVQQLIPQLAANNPRKDSQGEGFAPMRA